jgi:hypothetical protein
MVLPLPVKHGTGEKDVTFINLKNYPDFFGDLERGFPRPPSRSAHSNGITAAAAGARAPLEVVQVGDFEASFVPTVKDFSRLDERFRLSQGVWEKLPGYEDFGFAVFKLKPGRQNVQPMAFSFPRQDARTLFYPTVHIHDGKVHEKADFDHILYGQPSSDGDFIFHGWEESYAHALSFMNLPKAKGLVDQNQHCYKKELRGNLPNRDTTIACES